MLGHRVLFLAISRWHGQVGDDGPPLRVKVLDRDAKRKIDHLRVHYRQMTEQAGQARELERDAQVSAWSYDLTGLEFDNGSYRDSDVFSRAYVCVHNDHLALTSALTLQRFSPSMPIVVRMSQQGKGLAGYLSRRQDNIVTLGMDEACTEERLLGNG